jgi:NitT/TauT family transport system substrate-binding protein
MDKSLAYAAAHPEDARAILLTYTKIDKAVADKLKLPLWRSAIDRASLDVLADFLVQDKLVAARPDIAALLP